MLSGNQLYSVISLAVALVAIALGIYVIRTNRFDRAAQVFYLTMLVMFIGGCTDFFFLNAPDIDLALWLGRLLLFLLVLMMGTLFYLATYLPYERSSGWFHTQWPAFFSVLVLTALLPALFLTEEQLMHTSYGWGVVSSSALALMSALSVLYATAAEIMLAMQSKLTEDKRVRAQIGIVAVAIAAPVVYALVLTILELTELSLPPVLSPGFLIAAIIMAYAVLRHRLFTIRPSRKAKSQAQVRSALEYGVSHLYLEKKGQRAIEAFQMEMATGAVGAVICRTHPDLLRKGHDLKDVPMIWLAKQPGDNHIDPTNLSILQNSVLEFYRKNDHAVVLLEGLEYLLANNPLENVLRILYTFDDEVVVRQGLLLITFDPEVMSQKALALFVRDFQVVEG